MPCLYVFNRYYVPMEHIDPLDRGVPFSYQEALNRHYMSEVMGWYGIPTIMFPTGVPKEIHQFGYIVNDRQEALPTPIVSQIEFERLTQIVMTPTFDHVNLVINLNMLSRTKPNPVTGCWERKTSGKNGYGRVNDATRGIRDASAHRVFWQAIVGDEVGMQLGTEDVLDHRCLNKACCYPRHFRLTTIGSNNEAVRYDSRHNVQQRLVIRKLFSHHVELK